MTQNILFLYKAIYSWTLATSGIGRHLNTASNGTRSRGRVFLHIKYRVANYLMCNKIPYDYIMCNSSVVVISVSSDLSDSSVPSDSSVSSGNSFLSDSNACACGSVIIRGGSRNLRRGVVLKECARSAPKMFGVTIMPISAEPHPS